jgi:hypothetical protein
MQRRSPFSWQKAPASRPHRYHRKPFGLSNGSSIVILNSGCWRV